MVNRILLMLLGAASIFALADVRAQQTTPEPDFMTYTQQGIEGLQAWYNVENGLWDTTGWWNAANALTVLVEYMLYSGTSDYLDVAATTFERNAADRFLNHYYDDEGWWGLAWVRAYDLTGEMSYLEMAKTIFADMTAGWDSVCGGGLWWNKERQYKNAIPNELFLQLAARLHNHTPGDTEYLDWAQKTWGWFRQSGMINDHNLINDGLNDQCQNNGGITWTYNQGVILGGLVALYQATGDDTLLEQAQAIADAVLASSILADEDGILREPCELSFNCGADGPQFKGIFMRNLAYLYRQTGTPAYSSFISNNAESIWQKNRKHDNQFGLRWSGWFDRADAARQSSALDALNAALAVQTNTPD